MVWSLWKSPILMLRKTRSIRLPRPNVLGGVRDRGLEGGQLLLVVRLHLGHQVPVCFPLQVFANGGVKRRHVVLSDRRHELAAGLIVIWVGLAREDPLGNVEVRYAGEPFLLHVLNRHPDLLLDLSLL